MLTPQDIKVIREIIKSELSNQGYFAYATAAPQQFTIVGSTTATVLTDDQMNQYWSNQTKDETIKLKSSNAE